MARIELSEIAHSYQRKAHEPMDYALRQIDHVWEEGKAYALLGPSGCGKTTLLNIVSGLVKPSQGRVIFDGRDVTDLPTEQRNIAQVFQFPVIYDTMSVYDNLAFPLRNRRVPDPEIRQRVHDVADMLELSSTLRKRARGLTADEKQKISLARGLVRSDVAAVLFDEPLTVIDPHLKWQLRLKLKEVHERFNLTMIYVTHDQVEALTFADQVVVMLEGRVLQVGSPQDLFENPCHTFVGYFIGSPGMNFLPCILDDKYAVVDGQRVVLEEGVGTRGRAQGKQFKVGIRPIFLQLVNAPGDGALPVQVTDLEDLGNYKIATVRLGEHLMRVHLSEDQMVASDTAWLILPAEHIRLYADDVLVQ